MQLGYNLTGNFRNPAVGANGVATPGLMGSMAPSGGTSGLAAMLAGGGGVSPGVASWVQQPAQSPLINAASGYSYPLTSGLMTGLGSAPAGGTNWSQVALNMAGNPKAGPLAAVGTPNAAMGAPGAGSSSSGSSLGKTMGGLLTALATNPSLAKTAGNTVSNIAKGLMGSPAASPVSAAGPTGVDAATQAALDSGVSSDLSATGLDTAASNGGFGSLVGSVADPATSAVADQAALASADPATAAGLSDIPMGAGADAGAAGSGSSSALGSIAAAWPIAVGAGGLLGMDALFNKQSEQSPASIANMDYTGAANLANAAKQVGAGSTGPNGVYQGYGGVTQPEVQQALQAQSGLMQYLGNTALQPGSPAWQQLQTMGKANPVRDLVGSSIQGAIKLS